MSLAQQIKLKATLADMHHVITANGAPSARREVFFDSTS